VQIDKIDRAKISPRSQNVKKAYFRRIWRTCNIDLTIIHIMWIWQPPPSN